MTDLRLRYIDLTNPSPTFIFTQNCFLGQPLERFVVSKFINLPNCRISAINIFPVNYVKIKKQERFQHFHKSLDLEGED